MDLGVQAELEPGLRPRAQLADLVLPGAGRKRGQDRRLARHPERAAPGDHQSIRERLGQVGEQLSHLGGALQPVLRGRPPPLGLGDLGAVGNAQQDVVRLPLGRLDELHVVGGDQGQLAFDRQVDQRRLDLVLHLEAVAHQLDVETTGESSRSRSSNPSARPRLPLASARPTGPSGPPVSAIRPSPYGAS